MQIFFFYCYLVPQVDYLFELHLNKYVPATERCILLNIETVFFF